MTFKDFLIKVIGLYDSPYTEAELEDMTTAELERIADALEQEVKK